MNKKLKISKKRLRFLRGSIIIGILFFVGISLSSNINIDLPTEIRSSETHDVINIYDDYYKLEVGLLEIHISFKILKLMQMGLHMVFIWEV